LNPIIVGMRGGRTEEEGEEEEEEEEEVELIQ
jgi:hypothetical protein